MLDMRININGDIKNPLMAAIEENNIQLVGLLLLDKRLDPTIHNNMPIKYANINKYIKIYELLKNDKRVNVQLGSPETVFE